MQSTQNTRRAGRKTFTAQFLRSISLFGALSEDEAEGLVARALLVTREKHQVVFLEEDQSEGMYVVLCGSVKVINRKDGRERIVAIHQRGDYFGEMALLDGKTAPATVVALEPCEIAVIPREVFLEMMLRPHFMAGIVDLLCLRLREAWAYNKSMSFGDAEQKLRALLAQFAKRFGVNDAAGSIIVIKLTHRDIASHLAISRETVTRLLNKMRLNGEIEAGAGQHIKLLQPFFAATPPVR